MPESADEVYSRIQESVGPDGRLSMPEQSAWDIFPWEVVDGELAPKIVPPPAQEPARKGDDAAHPCAECDGADGNRVVWEDDNWLLSHPGRPTGLPVVVTLTPKFHEDSGILGDDRASEMGRIINRLVRIIENLPNIGRVHVHRWGDTSSHLHFWFFARTEGLTQVLGPLATEWNLMLPPGPEDVWRADLHTIATKLANWGGEARA